MATIFVSYGDGNSHHIDVDDATYEAIRTGQLVHRDGQGFFDEDFGVLVDHWTFNADEPGSVSFWLDDGLTKVAEHRAKKGR